MSDNYKLVGAMGMRRKTDKFLVCGMALISFAAGSLTTAWLMQEDRVKADSNRVFQLLVYHTVPGKVPALEARFEDASKLQAQHGIGAVGYWIPNGGSTWANTFVYLVAHRSREEAKKHWDAFHADPRFQEYVKEEQAEQLIDKVDSIFMRPADFSPMR